MKMSDLNGQAFTLKAQARLRQMRKALRNATRAAIWMTLAGVLAVTACGAGHQKGPQGRGGPANVINCRHLNLEKAGLKQIMDLAVEGGILKKAIAIDAFADESFATEITEK